MDATPALRVVGPSAHDMYNPAAPRTDEIGDDSFDGNMLRTTGECVNCSSHIANPGGGTATAGSTGGNFTNVVSLDVIPKQFYKLVALIREKRLPFSDCSYCEDTFRGFRCIHVSKYCIMEAIKTGEVVSIEL
jgi:hypothetical protein